MPDILHRLGVKSPSPRETYAALTTRAGLSAWWTHDTKGEAVEGGSLRFTFGEKGFFVMKVLTQDADRRVRWEVTDGPPEWIGTTIDFQLRQEGEYTLVLFKHQGWREPVEFMHHCSTKWAVFLMSLKALVETGKGSPAPHDYKLESWD